MSDKVFCAFLYDFNEARKSHSSTTKYTRGVKRLNTVVICLPILDTPSPCLKRHGALVPFRLSRGRYNPSGFPEVEKGNSQNYLCLFRSSNTKVRCGRRKLGLAINFIRNITAKFCFSANKYGHYF